MHAEAERVLHNLHVLSVISHNDKLLTNDDEFNIHSPTTFRAVWRFCTGERRNSNVTRIRICVRNAIDFISSSLEELTAFQSQRDGRAFPNSTMQLKVDTLMLQHLRMMDGVQKASQGLTNLLQTYRDDPALAAQIQLIIHEIGDFVTVVHLRSKELQKDFSGFSERARTEPRSLT